MSYATKTATLLVTLLVASAAVVVAMSPAHAQSSDEARKAARRAQLQMQSLQQEAQAAQAARAKVEADKAALDKKLSEQSQQVARLKGSLPRLQQQLKAAEEERLALAAKVAALEKSLAEQELLAESAQTAAQRSLKERDDSRGALQRQHDAQVALVSECSAKNERLLKVSAELLDRYRNKGFGEVLKQQDPVLGLGDVQMFNLVQEYRDKAEAERFTPNTVNR